MLPFKNCSTTDFNFSYKDWGIACTGLKVFYFTADEESKVYCDILKKL